MWQQVFRTTGTPPPIDCKINPNDPSCTQTLQPLTPPTTKKCPDESIIDASASCPTQSTPPPPTNNNPPPTQNNPTPPSGNDNGNNNPPSGGSGAVMVVEASAADLTHQVQAPFNSP